jgi:hypothetical protein
VYTVILGDATVQLNEITEEQNLTLIRGLNGNTEIRQVWGYVRKVGFYNSTGAAFQRSVDDAITPRMRQRAKIVRGNQLGDGQIAKRWN